MADVGEESKTLVSSRMREGAIREPGAAGRACNPSGEAVFATSRDCVSRLNLDLHPVAQRLGEGRRLFDRDEMAAVLDDHEA
ncbi:hypothetical protein QBC99_001553 [Beijerinckia sp. GAS462]|nr:hypothetical protein [Beijerinckia sp. GAS462]SEC03745.1 hypothetical protein SAMN05443249_1765 [Beijerinckia sp. 28-YEA-48]